MTRSSPRPVALIAMVAALGWSCTQPDGLVGVLGQDIIDHGDGMSRRYWLRPPGGAPMRLRFAEDPGLPPGTTIAVWGTPAGGAFVVNRLEERSSVEARRAPLVGAMPRAARRWAFVLVDVGGGVNLTKEAMADKLFSTTNPRSIRNWYREVSYGIQDLDGDVFGPLSFPDTSCDEDALAAGLRSMVPGGYDQYLWYIGKRLGACGWSGVGVLGSAVRPARDSWYNGDGSCGVVIQETGHNFGMLHSSSMRCTVAGKPAPFSTAPMDDCRHNEYGNPFDPMGDGCFHTNGYQKSYLDWISGCNVVTAKSSGVFTLFPLEQPCAGTQLLQIPMPAARPYRAVTTGIPERMSSLTNYYLELRTPVGWDGQLTPRVLVTIGGALKEAKRSGGRNWLLDMKPETATRSDAALAVGQTFEDPSGMGPRITVVAADATKATIRVELTGDQGGAAEAPGTGECEDGTMIASADTTCAAAPPPIATPDGGTARDASAPARDGAAPRDATVDLSPDSAPARDAEPEPQPDVAGPALRRDAAPAADTRPPPEPEEDAAPTTGPPPAIKGGCSCRVTGAGSDGGAVLALASALLLARRRRRSPNPRARLANLLARRSVTGFDRP